jgi:hypothetical protein
VRSSPNYRSLRPCTKRGAGTGGGIAAAVCLWMCVAWSLGGRALAAEGLAVDVTNASEPVLCAEKDNVTINFASKDVRGFRIEAAHPVYLGTIGRDSFAADWSACTGRDDPSAGASQPPERMTLYEDIDMWVVGLTFKDFWRPATATVRIGNRIEKGLHLLQIWMIRPMGGEEVLVFYPQDGYWRLRPLAPTGMAPTAFGSSFLIGPIDVEGRPIVKIKDVAFDPKTRTFSLHFERGGMAKLRLTTTDQSHSMLEVSLDRPIAGPFAALRSMYVTETNNDVARIAVLENGTPGWREEAIMAFKRATATHVWAGRTAPSRHNTSSPDMAFTSFSPDGEPLASPPR